VKDVTVILRKATGSAAWDEQAARVGGGFYHCYASVMYYATGLAAEPLFVKALDASGACVGVAAGTLSSSKVWPFSRYCRRAELPSLPVTADGDADLERAILERTEGELRRRGVFRVDVAAYESPHSAALLGALAYQLVPRTEFFIDLGRSLDDIRAAFSKGRRGDIRKAERLGVVIREQTTPETVDLTYELHDYSMSRRGVAARDAPERFRRARRDLAASGRVKVFVARLGGEPVDAMLCGLFGGKACNLVGGTNQAGYESGAPTLRMWEGIKYYHALGARTFNFGGAKREETGLYQFKTGFGPTVVDMPGGSKVLSRAGARLDGLRTLLRKVRP